MSDLEIFNSHNIAFLVKDFNTKKKKFKKWIYPLTLHCFLCYNYQGFEPSSFSQFILIFSTFINNHGNFC